MKVTPDISRSLNKILTGASGFAQRSRLGNATNLLRQLLDGGVKPHAKPQDGRTTPQGAQFLARSFGNESGSRNYKLYVPGSYRNRQMPLVVMLHGCMQTPDDFAAGTRMNEIAEQEGFLVAYPAQKSAANMQKCWNWFDAAHQHRDAGEPAVIAGLTRDIMQNWAVDPRRVYIAGLSAGGALAAIMGQAHPDIYAAIGVHSGLACGAARDMPSAFAAMNGGAIGSTRVRPVPTIVFHGDNDKTVHPRNGDAVVAQAAPAAATRTEDTTSAGGRRFRRTVHIGNNGKPTVEYWVVHGAGHAWCGGSPAGSVTDPAGPDASREMIRFFSQFVTRGE
jgi:poly(hydroxyalkanoate) depolymerase family esterase